MSELRIEDLKKGDLIVVFWTDASDERGSLRNHQGYPEVNVKDWGLFLGVSGRKRRLLLIGKDVVEVLQDWGATRIPLELIDRIQRILPRDEMVRYIKEVHSLRGRRIGLRKYRREVLRDV